MAQIYKLSENFILISPSLFVLETLKISDNVKFKTNRMSALTKALLSQNVQEPCLNKLQGIDKYFSCIGEFALKYKYEKYIKKAIRQGYQISQLLSDAIFRQVCNIVCLMRSEHAQ